MDKQCDLYQIQACFVQYSRIFTLSRLATTPPPVVCSQSIVKTVFGAHLTCLYLYGHMIS